MSHTYHFKINMCGNIFSVSGLGDFLAVGVWVINDNHLLSSIYGTPESLIPEGGCSTRPLPQMHPLLSLYNSSLQHGDTNHIHRRNMKSCGLCIVLSLAVAVSCVPVPQITVQDETFAEVCMFSLPGHTCVFCILQLRCVKDVHFWCFFYCCTNSKIISFFCCCFF